MNGPELTIGRGVIAELVRLAAFEVPGVARVGRGGPAWRRFLGGPAVSVRIRDDRVVVRLWVVARPGQPLGPLAGTGPDDRRGDRRAPARPGARGGDRAGRWRRGLTASGAGGPAAGWPWRPSSRPTSASAPRTPSSSGTWPRRSATRTRRPSPASWSRPSWSTATRSTPRSPGGPASTRSPASPGWTGRCSVVPYPRCYTRPRRPGWPSPSGSSWHAPTVENRCDASMNGVLGSIAAEPSGDPADGTSTQLRGGSQWQQRTSASRRSSSSSSAPTRMRSSRRRRSSTT